MLRLFGGRIGVEEVSDGLLRAAGSISGMMRRLGGAPSARRAFVAWSSGVNAVIGALDGPRLGVSSEGI